MRKLSIILVILIAAMLLFSCREEDSASKEDDKDEVEESDKGADGTHGGFNGEDDIIDYGAKSMDGRDSFTMTAKVTDVTDDVIEVEIISAPYENTGTFWVRTSPETKFYSKDGEISRSDIKVGDTVKIIYSGQVMLSYPPQIVAHSVTVE